MVDAVKKDEEVSKDYMKVYEKEQMLLRQGGEMEREKSRRDMAAMRTQSVETIMRKQSITLQQACELLDYTVEDYESDKKLLSKV